MFCFRVVVGAAQTSTPSALQLWRVRLRGWRRRFRRRHPRLRRALFALLILAIGAAWVTGLFGEIVRSVAATQLTSLLGADVTIEDVDLQLIPPRVAIEGVAIHSQVEGREGAEVLWLGTLSARIRPSDVTQVIKILSVRLEGLRADVLLDDGALVDLPGLQAMFSPAEEAPEEAPEEEPEEEPEPGPGPPPPRLELGTVRIKDLSVRVADRAEGLSGEIQDLDLDVRFDEGFHPASASLDVATLAVTTPDLSEEARALRLRATGEGDRIRLGELSVQADGAAVRLDGVVDLPAGLLSAAERGSVAGEATPTASGGADATGAPATSPAAEDPLAFLAGFAGQLGLEVSLDLPALKRVLPDIPDLGGSVGLEGAVVVLGPQVSGSADLSFADVAIVDGDTTYRIGSGALAVGGDRSRVEITGGQIDAGGGSLSLTGSIEPEAPGLPVSARVELKDIQLARLLGDLGLTGSWVMLAIDGPAEVAGTLDPLELSGEVALTTRQLRLYDDSWERAAALEPLLAVERIELSGPLRIDADGVYLDEALIASGRTRIFTDLTFGFDLVLDIALDIGEIVLDELSPVVGLSLAGHGWGDARVKGPVSDLMIAANLSLFDARFETFTLGDFTGTIVVPIQTFGFVERARAALEAGSGVAGLVPGAELSEETLTTAVAAVTEVNSVYYGDRFDRADELTAMLILDVDARYHKTRYSGDIGVFFGDELILWADADVPEGRIEDVLTIADVDLGDPQPITGDLSVGARVSGPLDALDGNTRGLSIEDATVYGELLEALKADVRLEGGDLHLAHARVEDGDGVVQLEGSLKTDGAVALSLKIRGLPLADIEAVTDADLPLTGHIDSDLTVGGTLDLPQIGGEIKTRGVAFGTLSLGTLALNLSTADETLAIDGSLTPETRLAARAGAGPEVHLGAEVGMGGAMPFRALLQVDELPLHPFLDLNDAGQHLDSGVAFSVEAAGSVTGAEDVPLTVSARLDNLFIERGRFRIQNYGPSDIEYVDGGVDIRYLTLLGPDTNLEVSGGLSPAEGFDLTATGTLNLTLVDLLVPDTFQRLDGRLTGPGGGMALHLSGPTDQPVLSGVADLKDMAVRADAFPQTVDAISAHVVIEDNLIRLEDLTGSMGGGEIQGGGVVRLGSDFIPSYLKVDLDANEVVLRYPDFLPPSEIHGDLTLEGELDNLLMSGRIFVDRSIYRDRINWEKDLLSFRPNRLDSVSLVEESDPLMAFSIAIIADDTLYMRNNVGNIQMSADLVLEGDTNLMGVSGTVDITRGKVYLLNNELDVVEGQVVFLDYREFNPFLDMTFQTEIQSYTISYQILGTLEDYQITSSSDSGLSERDINSLLAFGVLADELQGASANVVAQPALEFLAGSLGLEEQVEGVVPIDLDRFGIAPVVGEDGSTSVRFYGEKEIKQDKVTSSFHYDVGVRQDYEFTLEYRVSDTLSVVGDADQGNQINTDRLPNFGGRFKLHWEWE